MVLKQFPIAPGRFGQLFPHLGIKSSSISCSVCLLELLLSCIRITYNLGCSSVANTPKIGQEEGKYVFMAFYEFNIKKISMYPLCDGKHHKSWLFLQITKAESVKKQTGGWRQKGMGTEIGWQSEHRKLISHTQPRGLGGKRRGRKRGLWFYLAQTPSQSLHQTGWEARSVSRRKINTDAKSHETVKEMDRWGERKRTQKFNRKTLADWKKSNQKQGMWVWNEQIKGEKVREG